MLDMNAFLTSYNYEFPAYDNPGIGLNKLLEFIDYDRRITDRRHRAYILATVLRECGPDYEPRTELGPHSYFSKYDPGTKLGKQLGNLFPGDGFNYRGRGYVQITGRRNYSMMSHLQDIDLVTNPDKALVPSVAYNIMSIGLSEGLFTGKKLADYLTSAHVDYFNARRCVNGLDRAEAIADHACRFEKILLEADPEIKTAS